MNNASRAQQTTGDERNRAMLLAGAGIGLAMAGRELLRRRREVDLRNQVALITGGSRGLGLALARELAREGCRIAICARDDAELARAREDLTGRGARVMAVVCDVSDRRQVEDMAAAVTQRFGQVDILVNNAGVIQVGPAPTMTLEDYEGAMGVMFWGVVYPTLAVLPQMRERGSGRIVNITSIGGKVSVPHLMPYTCAKFAAVGFSEGMRAELARDGIRVVTIVPGLMRTGGYLNARFKGRQEAEYTWFSLSSSLPFLSMPVERAAREIVRAARRGDAELTLTLPANLLARFHGLFPGFTADLLGLVNRFLPAADGRQPSLAGAPPAETAPGWEIHQRLEPSLLDPLTALGRAAAERFNQGVNGSGRG